MKKIINKLSTASKIDISGSPSGYDALVLTEIINQSGKVCVFVARDDKHMTRMSEALSFFAPQAEQLNFPAWDCLPYDRSSPNTAIVGQRINTLTRLLDQSRKPRALLTTVSALLQRVVPRDSLRGVTLSINIGDQLSTESLVNFLITNGYGRSETVMEAGEFSVRGSIIDVFPSGASEPLRMDFFGDDVESIRTFNPIDQRTTGKKSK